MDPINERTHLVITTPYYIYCTVGPYVYVFDWQGHFIGKYPRPKPGWQVLETTLPILTQTHELEGAEALQREAIKLLAASLKKVTTELEAQPTPVKE